MLDVITDNLDIWTTAQKQKKAVGRGKAKKEEAYGIKKLRELILELAVRGKLVAQDPKDEPASVLLEKIAEEKQRLIDEGKIKKQKALPEIEEDGSLFKLPDSWKITRFGTILDFTGGSQPPKSTFSDDNRANYVQLIQIRDLGPKPQPVYVPKDKVSKFCTTEDIMIGRYGASVGKVFWGKDGAYNVALIKVDNNLGAYFNKFLYLLMQSPVGQSLFLGISRSAQAGFSKNDINPKAIPLPPLAEQHRIVAKVDELMALCDQLEQEQADHQATHQTLVKTLLNGLILRYGSLRHGSLRQAQGERSYSDCPELVEGHVRGNAVHPELVVRQAHHVRSNTVHPELVEGSIVEGSIVEGSIVEGSALSPVSSELFEEHFDTLFTTEDSIDQLKQTILQLAVMGKLVPQNPKDEPASILLEKIAQEKAKLIKEGKIKKQKALPEITEDEKPFGLPEGWEWSRIGTSSLSTDYGLSEKTFDNSNGIPVLKMGDIKNGEVILGGQKTVSKEVEGLPELFLKEGDLLYNRTNSAELVGKTGVFTGSEYEYTFASYLIRIRLDQNFVASSYLNICMNSPVFRETQINPHLKQQCGQANVNGTIMKNMRVPIPPLAEQHRIVTKVNQLLSLCDTLKANLNQAQITQTQLADTIVKQAVN